MKQILRRSTLLLFLAPILAACGGAPAAATAVPAPASTANTTSAAVATTAAATALATEAASTATAGAPSATATTAAATAAPAQNATTTSAQTAEEIKTAAQKTIDQWGEAFSTADKGLLDKTIDPKALAVRRTQEALLKYYSEAQGGTGTDWSGKVRDIRRRDKGYVQADVESRGRIRTFILKQVNGQWLISEPTRAELGKRQKLESTNFTLQYYAWDSDVAPQISTIMEEVYTKDVAKMGKGPDKKTLVTLVPTAEATPGGSSGTFLAFYRRGSGAMAGTKEIVANSPNSFGFGGYDPAAGWQGDFANTVAHEYAHLVNDCCFTPIARQNDWMTEGLAVYVSEGGYTNGYIARVAYAVKNDSLIPIKAAPAQPGAAPQSLEYLSILDKDSPLAYGEAATLVDYIVTNYGGIDGYWKLIGDYDKTQNFEQSLQNVLKISFADFDKGWRAELKKRLGA